MARRIVGRRSTDGSDDAEPDEARATTVEISLGHVHLPKLEAGGVVERTADGRYDVTPLGDDLERAARAFESHLDAGAGEMASGVADEREPEAVPASDYDGGR